MSLDEETLEAVAHDGQMNYDKWPPIVEPLLQRINYVASHEFEIPRPYPIMNPSRRPLSSPLRPESSNEPPAATPTQNGPSTIPATPTPSRNLPPVPLFPSTSTAESTPTTSQIADSLPPPTQSEALVLPTPLLQLLDGITKTIRSSFSTLPPHTIQRLAELILDPKRHYRTLPAWLRALDRTVSVTSTADIFPLPRAMPLPSHVIDSSLLPNGVHSSEVSDDKGGLLGEGGGGILWMNRDAAGDIDKGYLALGSDESLGGALLTPIPWLRNGSTGIRSPSGEDSSETTELNGSADTDDLLGGPIEVPTSSGSPQQPQLTVPSPPSNPLVPEREDGAVTQGELIRQEQEAGVVPVGHSEADSRGMMLDDDDEEDEDEDEEEMEEGEEREAEMPHARGPMLLGAVDVGRVGGRDVEVDLSLGAGDHGTTTRKEGVNRVRGVRDAQEVLAGGPSTDLADHTTDAVQMETQHQPLEHHHHHHHHHHHPADEQARMQLLQDVNESDHFPSTTTTTTTADEHHDEEHDNMVDVPAGDDDDDVVLTDPDGKTGDEPRYEVGDQLIR